MKKEKIRRVQRYTIMLLVPVWFCQLAVTALAQFFSSGDTRLAWALLAWGSIILALAVRDHWQ